MSNKVRNIIAISVISILVILIIVFTVIALNSTKEKAVIDTVADTYSEDNIQKNIEKNLDDEKIDIEKLFLENQGKDVIGVIKIEKINFEGLVYENTTLETLAKGVGHFTNSPYINGNVCLAAHNTNKFWAKLNTIEVRRQDYLY